MKLDVESASEGTQRKKRELLEYHFFSCLFAVSFEKKNEKDNWF